MNQPFDMQRELTAVATDLDGFARLTEAHDAEAHDTEAHDTEANDEGTLKGPACQPAIRDETIHRRRGRIANTAARRPIEIINEAGHEHMRDALIGATSG